MGWALWKRLQILCGKQEEEGKKRAASIPEQRPLMCNRAWSVFAPVNIMYMEFKTGRKWFINIPTWLDRSRILTNWSLTAVDLNPSLSYSSFTMSFLPLHFSAFHICNLRELYLKKKKCYQFRLSPAVVRQAVLSLFWGTVQSRSLEPFFVSAVCSVG